MNTTMSENKSNKATDSALAYLSRDMGTTQKKTKEQLENDAAELLHRLASLKDDQAIIEVYSLVHKMVAYLPHFQKVSKAHVLDIVADNDELRRKVEMTFNVKLAYRNGAERVDYEADPKYCELKAALDARKRE